MQLRSSAKSKVSKSAIGPLSRLPIPKPPKIAALIASKKFADKMVDATTNFQQTPQEISQMASTLEQTSQLRDQAQRLQSLSHFEMDREDWNDMDINILELTKEGKPLPDIIKGMISWHHIRNSDDAVNAFWQYLREHSVLSTSDYHFIQTRYNIVEGKVVNYWKYQRKLFAPMRQAKGIRDLSAVNQRPATKALWQAFLANFLYAAKLSQPPHGFKEAREAFYQAYGGRDDEEIQALFVILARPLQEALRTKKPVSAPPQLYERIQPVLDDHIQAPHLFKVRNPAVNVKNHYYNQFGFLTDERFVTEGHFSLRHGKTVVKHPLYVDHEYFSEECQRLRLAQLGDEQVLTDFEDEGFQEQLENLQADVRKSVNVLVQEGFAEHLSYQARTHMLHEVLNASVFQSPAETFANDTETVRATPKTPRPLDPQQNIVKPWTRIHSSSLFAKEKVKGNVPQAAEEENKRGQQPQTQEMSAQRQGKSAPTGNKVIPGKIRVDPPKTDTKGKRKYKGDREDRKSPDAPPKRQRRQ